MFRPDAIVQLRINSFGRNIQKSSGETHSINSIAIFLSKHRAKIPVTSNEITWSLANSIRPRSVQSKSTDVGYEINNRRTRSRQVSRYLLDITHNIFRVNNFMKN